jgi:formylglycine-generating enzyme required for sulfatase activity
MPKREPENKGHQVFISYSNEKSDKAGSDRQIADMICSALESENIRCWIDHRDIMPGEKWVNAMFNAVEQSKVMVLVFSANANRSQWVEDEITYALDEKIRIIPFRVDNVTPQGALRVLKVRCQWIEAQQPPQKEDLIRLVRAVHTYLEKYKENEKETVPTGTEIPGNNLVEEKKFEHYLSNAMDYYINENYEKAWSNILEAELIKSSDKVRQLKKKIKGKIAGKKEKERLAAETKEKPGDVKAVESKAKKVYKNQQGFQETDLGDGIIMVSIPPGKFEMGSNEYDNEKPPHTVFLDGYWMGKYEVTVKQFGLFVEDAGYVTEAESSGGAYAWTGQTWEKKKDINWKNPGFKQQDSHPVVCVSWNDALEYCRWLSNKKGVNFKLPTEAQWEKAARGTDGRKYPWGDTKPGETLANFNIEISKTTPVGSYPAGASPYGLLDTAGNVWEWCSDWYDPDYYKNAPKENPMGPKSGTGRVMRGGGWADRAVPLRCAYRLNGYPYRRFNTVGFRLCQDNK